jgi:hypothetical protein
MACSDIGDVIDDVNALIGRMDALETRVTVIEETLS